MLEHDLIILKVQTMPHNDIYRFLILNLKSLLGEKKISPHLLFVSGARTVIIGCYAYFLYYLMLYAHHPLTLHSPNTSAGSQGWAKFYSVSLCCMTQQKSAANLLALFCFALPDFSASNSYEIYAACNVVLALVFSYQ